MAPGPDADLDRVGTGVDERLGTLAGRDVAADDLDVPGRRILLQPLDHLDQHPYVAVRRVGHEHVDTRVDQGGGALPGVAEVADGGTDEQPSVGVVRRVGELLALDEVLDRDQPAEVAGLVDQREPLALVLAQQAGRLVAGDADRAGDQRHRGHHLVDLGGRPLRDRGEPQVTVGDDAEQPVVGVDHGEPRDAVLAADAVEVLERLVGADGDGVGDDAGLGPFDEVDLVGLILDRQVAVQHAEAALAGHRDGHPALGHGVHRGADQRHLQADLAGQPRGRVDVGRRQVGVARRQQHVVVGQAEVGELVGNAVGVAHRSATNLSRGGASSLSAPGGGLSLATSGRGRKGRPPRPRGRRCRSGRRASARGTPRSAGRARRPGGRWPS